jgi:hypothetical protein
VVPERFKVWSCIGCGAMGTDQPCLGPCGDRALDLVWAGDHDAVVAQAAGSRERARPLLEVVRELASATGGEPAYRALQQRARDALHEAGAQPEPRSADTFRAWICTGCGRVEAPQPCLGICVRRPAEVVRADHHADAAVRAADAERDARGLAALVSRLAWSTPRDGGWEASLAALRGAALGLLG